MSVIRKADFYYGCLLSVLINEGWAPAIIEPGDSRRIYSITTNHGDLCIYAKYGSLPLPRQNSKNQLWQFSFSKDEINFIKDCHEKQIFFALICGRKGLTSCELPILSLTEVRDCLGVNSDYPNSYRITVRYEKGAHGLKVYGTGRADVLNGCDNTIRVSRDLIKFVS